MEYRTNEIYNWIAANPNRTEREIAAGQGLVKSPYTRGIIFWLIAQGYIARSWDESRHPKAYVYYCQATTPMDLQ